MRAAVLTEIGTPLRVIDGIPIPRLSAGQVLVKIAYSGVCHSQVMEANGARGHDRWLPHMLGHEATGRVVAAGSGVTKVSVGELVVLSWIKSSGCEAGGCQYDTSLGVVNAGGVTTFSDYAVVSENRLVALPEGMPLDLGVLLGCALPTGAGMVINEVQPQPGQSVAVFGVGGIGVSALMAARSYDLSMLIAVDVNDDKLALARNLGADHIIDARVEDPVACIVELTPPGADHCIDASGQVSVIEQAFLASHPKKGRTIFASHPRAGEKIQLEPHHLISGRQIAGSWGGNSYPDRDIPRFAELWRSGALNLEALASSRRYTLDEINEALDDLASGRTLRPIVELNANV